MRGPDRNVGTVHVGAGVCDRCGSDRPGVSAWDKQFARHLWFLCYPCLGSVVNIVRRVEWRRRWVKEPIRESGEDA